MISLVALSALLYQTETPTETGFRPMFNGRDLSGWVNVNCAPNTFTVRDGMIITTGIPTGVLRTKRMYENFIVEFDWMHMKKGGNSGFFIHSGPITVRGQPFTKAFEIQVLDGDDPKGLWTGQGDVFSIHGASFVPDRPHPDGWERCLPSERRAHSYGHWNHYRVESRDGRITLAVNGKVVSGGSKCNPRKGYICLESEGSECHFKNIRIKELTSSKPPASAIAESDRGFVSLYNGLDLSGWAPEVGHEHAWSSNDWILKANRTDDSINPQLRSSKEYRDFLLIVDWRLDPTAAQAKDRPMAGTIALCGVWCEIYIALDGRGSGGIIQKAYNVPPDSVADRPIGEWNRFEITHQSGHTSVRLNGKEVLTEATFPGTPGPGPIGLRSMGAPLELANIYIKAL